MHKDTGADAKMSVVHASFCFKGHTSECLATAGQGSVTEHRHDHPNFEPELMLNHEYTQLPNIARRQ